MPGRIGIIDYGAGNLFNVVNALVFCGAKVEVITEASDIDKFDKIILPGVGAFQDGINFLKERKLMDLILEYLYRGKPYLGICLGMQFLFEVSKEFGTTPGFSIIKGKVVPIPTQTDSNQLRRVPHVGWASLNIDNTDCPLLKNLMGTDSFYFVHSFMCSPVNPSVVASNVDYLGQKITASLSHKNIFGTQFHPEKSGKSGLKVLKNFIDL